MEFIQQNILLVAMAVLSGSALIFMSFRRPMDRNAVSLTQATLLINRENAQVIDVSESSEYLEGHLPEARNFPAEQLEERIGELDKYKDTPLILVCRTGARSAKASKLLTKHGFSRVHSLEGGIAAWRAASLPLKKGSKK